MTAQVRKTKIVTTLGPSTDKGNVLEEIIKAGANIVRMNFLMVVAKITSNARLTSCYCQKTRYPSRHTRRPSGAEDSSIHL